MSLTKLSLAGNNLVTSRLGTGKSLTFFAVYFTQRDLIGQETVLHQLHRLTTPECFVVAAVMTIPPPPPHRFPDTLA
jgi:hypothetical protein